MGFIFGGDTPWSYDDIQKKRQVAEALMSYQTPQTFGQGLGAIGRALQARSINKKASARQAELDTEWAKKVDTFGLDPARSEIFKALEPGQRNSAVLGYLDKKDAERRAAANRSASAPNAEIIKAITADGLVTQEELIGALGSGANRATIDALSPFVAKGPDVTQITGDEAAAMGLDPLKVYNVKGDGTVSAIGGGVNVNVNTARAPTGYRWNADGTELEAIPGGPEDTAGVDAVAQDNRERSGEVVTEDIARALKIIESAPGWTTGLGAVLANVPGTQAKSLGGLLETIKANVGFDRLQQMRDASKTGGALGAINQTEMGLLTAALGNLEQSLSGEELAYNLTRLNQIYNEIIHGPQWRDVVGGAPKRYKFNPETGELEAVQVQP